MVPSLATENSETANDAVSDGSTMAPTGRDVVPAEEEAGLTQALVFQYSLVTLKYTKNQIIYAL